MGSAGAIAVTRVLLVWFTGANLPISQGAVVQLDPQVDSSTLVLAGTSVLASLIVFGLAPAVQLTRVQLRPALAGGGGSSGHPRWRTRRTLIAVQVMISLSFFLMAAFAVGIVRSERARPSGVDVDRLAHRHAEFLPAAVERAAGSRGHRSPDGPGPGDAGPGICRRRVGHALRHHVHARRRSDAARQAVPAGPRRLPVRPADRGDAVGVRDARRAHPRGARIRRAR